METPACRGAISVARQFGLQRIHLETNCLELVPFIFFRIIELVQSWEKKDLQRSAIGPILEEIDGSQEPTIDLRSWSRGATPAPMGYATVI
jgi:hypothetical protein